MKQTDQTLLEQMRITEFDIEQRKRLFLMAEHDVEQLKAVKPLIERNIDMLVSRFYGMQTSIPEIALLIGDADTLKRLGQAQRKYISDLFSGLYDLEYVNNRLRIGLVHKRIGVEPKLYLSAVQTLKKLLVEVLRSEIQDAEQCAEVVNALEKLMLFDITLVFDTYIRSLLSEIELSKEKTDQYARVLEERVRDRTQQLEHLSRTDALTGLLNVRYLNDILLARLRAAERRREPLSLIYLDVNDFKQINDTHGHQAGDDILRTLGRAILKVSRKEDYAFRYGGDEFCIVLPNCTEEKAQERYVARLIKELAVAREPVSLSIGVLQTGPDQYLAPMALVHEADQRMYANKREQKRVRCEQPERTDDQG